MGSYQGKADTTKITHSGKNQQMEFICMEMRGWRKSMQDSAIYELEIQTPKNENNFKNSLFAVFDGHGTSYISRYLQENLVSVLTSLEQYKNQLYVEALEKTFMLLDDMMLSKDGQKQLQKIKDEEDAGCKQSRYHIVGNQIGDFCGSTANVVLITEKFYYIANTGDSRSILCRNGYTIGLSRDHKPENPLQLKRIKKANGFVSMGRVNDILSVSRAFGDFDMKQDRDLKWNQQVITCKPDIQVFAKSPRDDFILIACDGIWQNSQKSKTIVEMFMKEKSFQKQNYLQALQQLFNKLVAKNVSQPLGQDNMTALFIKFNRPQDQQNGQERLHVQENVLWEQRNNKMRRAQSNIN